MLEFISVELGGEGVDQNEADVGGDENLFAVWGGRAAGDHGEFIEF